MRYRCSWANSSELDAHYHDTEWGVPLHDDQRLFEFLLLEGAQAGLSWSTVLAKRENYRAALDGFDPEIIVNYGPEKIAELLQNPGIIRNRLKVNSVVINARAFLDVQEEFGSFDTFIWSFVEGTPIKNQWATEAEVPATTAISDQMSKTLKKRGFKFVGSTICYAYMQAAGLVNDHTVNCFRYHEVS